jgi:hypothetical protein
MYNSLFPVVRVLLCANNLIRKALCLSLSPSARAHDQRQEMLHPTSGMCLFRADPVSPALQQLAPLLDVLRRDRLRQRVAELCIPRLEASVVRQSREHDPQVVEGRHPGPDDGDSCLAQGSQRPPHGEVLCGRVGGEDGELDDGNVRFGVDEEHWDEDTVVPALQVSKSARADSLNEDRNTGTTYLSHHPAGG